MIAPDKEVAVSLLFFIINNSSSSQTNILAQLMDFFTGNGHLEDLSKISEPEKLLRSEERRVGKECRSRWSPYH